MYQFVQPGTTPVWTGPGGSGVVHRDVLVAVAEAGLIKLFAAKTVVSGPESSTVVV